MGIFVVGFLGATKLWDFSRDDIPLSGILWLSISWWIFGLILLTYEI